MNAKKWLDRICSECGCRYGLHSASEHACPVKKTKSILGLIEVVIGGYDSSTFKEKETNDLIEQAVVQNKAFSIAATREGSKDVSAI